MTEYQSKDIEKKENYAFKIFYLFAVQACFLAASCSENTSNLGGSLIDDTDKLTINSDSFEVSTKSVLSGAVLSRDANNHLGKVLDAETGTYITSNFYDSILLS